MNDPKHPVWAIIRLIVMMIALTTILYFTANHFDTTELTTIITMFFAGAGIELLPFLTKRQ